jgi:hypothetical protein
VTIGSSTKSASATSKRRQAAGAASLAIALGTAGLAGLGAPRGVWIATLVLAVLSAILALGFATGVGTRRPDIVIDTEIVSGQGHGTEVLSVMVYNARDYGETALAVVPTVEATYSARLPVDQETAEENARGLGDIGLEALRERVCRSHGRWVRDAFGTWQGGGDPAEVRRRNLGPTGERERLGLLVKIRGDDNAYLLDGSSPETAGLGLMRGYWKIALTLRGENIRPVRADFRLTNYGPGMVLHRVKVGRILGIGPVRERVIASTAARYPQPPYAASTTGPPDSSSQPAELAGDT